MLDKYRSKIDAKFRDGQEFKLAEYCRVCPYCAPNLNRVIKLQSLYLIQNFKERINNSEI